MTWQSIARPLTYLLLATGGLLSFVSSVVPHFDAGYVLMFSVLLTGLLPYLVYAMVLPWLDGWPLVLPGVLIVAVHSLTVASERFIAWDGYSDGAIYYVPLLLAAFALALLAWTLRTHPPGRD